MIASLTTVIAVLLAAAVVGGAVVAVSTRGPRLAVLGLLVALLAAPFVADPLPDLRGVAARIAGGVLAAYPLLMVSRGAPEPTTGSRGGWPADALLAVTAAVMAVAASVGWDVAGGLGTGLPGDAGAFDGAFDGAFPGPYLPAVAAGAALLAVAAGPVGFARDPFRLTIGLCLGVLGLSLVQTALGGPPSAFTDLCVAVLLATIAGGGALLARSARRAATVPALGPARPRGLAGAAWTRGPSAASLAGETSTAARPDEPARIPSSAPATGAPGDGPAADGPAGRLPR
jgi:hypothetical protein